MFKIKLAVLTIAMCFMSTLLADTVENEAESKDCTTQILACGTGLISAGVEVGKAFKECKPLRQCKKESRVEKRVCKKEAKGEKKSCKDVCRDDYGDGKEYRNCAESCRDDKKEAKSECKETKREDIDVCRDNFKTTACTTARGLAGGAAAGSIPACGLAVICIKANSSNSQEGQ